MSLLYKIALSFLPGIGPITARKLVSYIGNIEDIFIAPEKKLKKVPGIGQKLAKQLITTDVLKRAEKELEFIEKNNIKVFFYLDRDYPKKLKNYETSPILFYQKGDFFYENKIFLAVVGTRKPDDYGKFLCEKLIKQFAEEGIKPVIVSGLAYGIDYCAHKMALENNFETIAVLGHGLKFIYPKTHKKIAKQIIQHGALISEYPFMQKIEPRNFVQRNRIIAALSDAVVIVQSPYKGGSLITGEYAIDYYTPVFTFPGRIYDDKMKGCNYFIKTNRAALIQSAKDIIYEMQWENKQTVKQQTIIPELDQDEKLIFNFLKQTKQPQNIDIISYKTDLNVSKVLSILFNLEMKGLVKALPGRMYTLTI